MYSSSKAHKKSNKQHGKSKGGRKGLVKGNDAHGETGNEWHTVTTKFGQTNVNSEDAGKYFFDSYRVGSADGKVKQLGKYFCNCEELNKLIHKNNLTKKERTVLVDMARRYKVCLNFAHGGRCYEYNCGFKHTWFDGKDALRQAGCELKFTGKMCSFCKARPGVVSEFKRRRAEREARRRGNSDRASTAGSTMSMSSSSTSMLRRPSTSLYDPKSLALNAVAVQSKPTMHKAEEFPSLGSTKTARPKALNYKKCIPKTKEQFEPGMKSDKRIKFSELPGTDLSQPIGSKASPWNTSRIPKSEPAASTTEASTPAIEKDVYNYSEAPSEYDPNDYTSEVSSNTSMAHSNQEPQETAMNQEPREMPANEVSKPVAGSATSAVPPKDTLSMMHDIAVMMQQMRAEMQTLKVENAELRARVAK